MTSIKCRIHVDETGEAILQLPYKLPLGEHEVIISINDSIPLAKEKANTISEDWDSLLLAGEGNLDFWDNPIDDEIWNHA